MRRFTAVAVLGSLASLAAVPAAASAVTPATGVRVTVALGRLNAPKHLTWAKGALFVVQSGSGGPDGTANCVTGPSTSGGTTKYCQARTGAITIKKGKTSAWLGGLPSVIQESSKEVSGAGAVAFNRDGQAAVVTQDVLVNKAGGNALPKPLGAAFGKLLLLSPSGKITVVDIARFAARHPEPASSLGTAPGEVPYDSDPYDVAAYRGGFVVADAAANSLLQVSRSGRIHLLARFPFRKERVAAGVLGNPKPITLDAQAVPTSVAVGPDGALYVGLLRGVPSNPGTAYIYRVVPGHAPRVWARGLTAVTAIAFDHQGRLLATEYSTAGLLAPPTVPGALVRIGRHGHTVTTLAVPGLVQPTGVAVGPGGAVYVSNYGGNLASDAHPGLVVKITGLG